MKPLFFCLLLLTPVFFVSSLNARPGVRAQTVVKFRLRANERFPVIDGYGPAVGLLGDKWWAFSHVTRGKRLKKGTNTFILNGKRLFTWQGLPYRSYQALPKTLNGELVVFFKKNYFYYRGRKYGPYDNTQMIQDKITGKNIGVSMGDFYQVRAWIYSGRLVKPPSQIKLNDRLHYSTLRPGPQGDLAYIYSSINSGNIKYHSPIGDYISIGDGKIKGPFRSADFYGQGKNIALRIKQKQGENNIYNIEYRRKKWGPYHYASSVIQSPNLRRFSFAYMKYGPYGENYVRIDNKKYGPYSGVSRGNNSHYERKCNSHYGNHLIFSANSKRFAFSFIRNQKSWLNLDGREIGPFKKQELLRRACFTGDSKSFYFTYSKRRKLKEKAGTIQAEEDLPESYQSLHYYMRVGKHDFGPYTTRPYQIASPTAKSIFFTFRREKKEYIHFKNREMGPYDDSFKPVSVQGKVVYGYVKGQYVYYRLDGKLIGKFRIKGTVSQNNWKYVALPGNKYFFFGLKKGKTIITFKNGSSYTFPPVKKSHRFITTNPYHLNHKKSRLYVIQMTGRGFLVRRIRLR